MIGFGESAIVLASSVAWNADLGHSMAAQYAKAALSIHLNPLKLHQAYLKLGALEVAQGGVVDMDSDEGGSAEQNKRVSIYLYIYERMDVIQMLDALDR